MRRRRQQSLGEEVVDAGEVQSISRSGDIAPWTDCAAFCARIRRRLCGERLRSRFVSAENFPCPARRRRDASASYRARRPRTSPRSAVDLADVDNGGGDARWPFRKFSHLRRVIRSANARGRKAGSRHARRTSAAGKSALFPRGLGLNPCPPRRPFARLPWGHRWFCVRVS